jgi:c(7)-type cytochrome triheme protein
MGARIKNWMAGGLALCVAGLLWASPTQGRAESFSHEGHEKAGLSLKCEMCHGGSVDGKIDLPGKDNHKPCSNEGCHAAEYRKRGSTLCANCHDHNEPWRANPVKPSFSAVSEFFIGFSHESHEKRLQKADSGFACQTCHPVQAGAPVREADPAFLALGHKDCATCHSSIEPKMTSCGGCHQINSKAPPPKGSAADPKWRVAEKFKHESHQTDKRAGGQKLDCRACHGDVMKVAAGERIPRPSMEGCASSCHNGQVAFKATGFTCAKCHGPAPKNAGPASAPSSVPANPPK